MSANKNVREIAVHVLVDVVRHGRSLDGVLQSRISKLFDSRDRALCQELCYGVLRWYPRLTLIVEELLEKPLKRKDEDIRCLILLGLYQLQYLNIPAHAAVAESVNVTVSLGKKWAKGLVNAVLRSYQRNVDLIKKSLDGNEQFTAAHPVWMLDMLKKGRRDSWQQIIETNTQHPPMSLRINTRKTSQNEYVSKLGELGISASESVKVESGIVLDRPCDVRDLPGFSEGLVSVQDLGAQLAIPILDLRPGQSVLDACAAPGGKTCHIYEFEPLVAKLVAIDSDEKRMRRVQENIDRTLTKAELICADARATESWWNGEPFDRILLDAPCSAIGVIRRHPDIKLLRKPSDIDKLVKTQSQLLAALWPLLKPGGVLVYVTCSVLPVENELQMMDFLGSQRLAREIQLDVNWGVPLSVGRQVITGTDRMDGFYYAKIQKIAV
ncbi:MAG: 16S rRNA (cytosine(967)-C(5))-methyltransferase RsmB [Gammaproteobacteria bacterium]